jgi:tryptophan halogenase|tara:strand:+ start:1232 stop:2839 length:1608 start_codon:yes stop_codon:yes gene_type:complete
MNITNDIKIIGGGTAGWMAAATLISQFPNKEVTLIESPNISTVGVGESTIGQINNWLALLGIQDADFMPHCDASYKLSIGFENFYRKDSGKFQYPFGRPYTENNKSELNDWYFKKFLYPDTPVSDYAECLFPQMALVTQNKIHKNLDGRLPDFNFHQDVAYHFDATKFSLWLRDYYCLPRGVNHVLAEVKDVKLNDDVGVEYVTLDDGSKVTADLFLDCTGFKALLIDKVLKEPFESFEDVLPNNSAWATAIPYRDKEKELVGYTNCTAIDNGWVWNIPLWSRIGSGYVYSDKYVSDNDALLEFQKHIGHGEELDYRNIKMRTGTHRRTWVKNVCAIGLSSGFIEPLESGGLYTMHEFLLRLVRTLQRDHVSQWDRDVYNSATKTLLTEFKEFVAMHFALSHRDDTEYWRDVMNKQYSDNLVNMHPSFVHGYVSAVFGKMRDYRFNSDGGLHCIATGMNWFPTDFPTMQSLNYNSREKCQLPLGNDVASWEMHWKSAIDNLNNRKQHWRDSVKDAPFLLDVLRGIHMNKQIEEQT